MSGKTAKMDEEAKVQQKQAIAAMSVDELADMIGLNTESSIGEVFRGNLSLKLSDLM